MIAKLNQTGVTALIVILGFVILTAATLGYIYIKSPALLSLPPIANTTTNTPVASPTLPQTISLDFLNSDQVTIANLDASPFLIDKTNLPDGSTKYQLTSALSARPNLVVVQNGQIIFRRIITFASNTPLPKFSDYQQTLGNPTQTLTGSKYYGYHIRTLIYPASGYALIGNTQTDQIYEIQRYAPVTLSEYKSKWGVDLAPDSYQNLERF